MQCEYVGRVHTVFDIRLAFVCNAYQLVAVWNRDSRFEFHLTERVVH